MKVYLVLIFSLFTVLPINAQELKLIGTALAEFSIFKIDVYQISYYKNDKGQEELLLDYKTDVKKKYSIMGWDEGLKHLVKNNPKLKPSYDWIIKQVIDLKEGDKYVIRKKGDSVTMLKNNITVGSINDPNIAAMVFEPWLGTKPVDKELKSKLLGKK